MEQKHESSLSLCRNADPPYRADLARQQNTIGARLREARKNKKLTIAELAQKLEAYGIHLKNPSVSRWETGETVPNAYQLVALCHVLQIENGLSYFTGEIQGQPELLNAEGRRMLSAFREFLESRPAYTQSGRMRMIQMPVSLLSASAGFGDYLDEENFELQDFPEKSVPAGADFAVRVNGDSMEPLYRDGQLVWVEVCTSLTPGETGLFVADGEGFVKTYDERLPEEADREAYLDSSGVLHPQVILISQNKAYPPRIITPDQSFRIVGRVLR